MRYTGSMILALHITAALLSLIIAGWLYVRPSRLLLGMSYSLIAGTITSGTLLIVSQPTHMLEACVMGLVYVGLTTTGTVLGKRKLSQL